MLARKVDWPYVDFHWHHLRHTFASRLTMAGVDLATVQKLMDHKDIKTTMRYAHLSPAHMHEAVQRLNAPHGDTATDTSAPAPTAGKGTTR